MIGDSVKFNYEVLERLGALREKGHLTEEEFEREKKRLLDGLPPPSVAEVAKDDSRPAIWNPSAAVWWSLILGTYFGTFLHAKNWNTLGQYDRARNARWWLRASLPLPFLFYFYRNDVWASWGVLFLNLLLLFVWLRVAGKAQIAFVKEKAGSSYRRKSLILPLVALPVLLVLAVKIFAVALNSSGIEEPGAFEDAEGMVVNSSNDASVSAAKQPTPSSSAKIVPASSSTSSFVKREGPGFSMIVDNTELEIFFADGRVRKIGGNDLIDYMPFIISDPFEKLKCENGIPLPTPQTSPIFLPEHTARVNLTSSVRKFSFFNEQPTTIGILEVFIDTDANSGGLDKLFLFDTESALEAQIEFSHCRNGIWGDRIRGDRKYPPSYKVLDYDPIGLEPGLVRQIMSFVDGKYRPDVALTKAVWEVKFLEASSRLVQRPQITDEESAMFMLNYLYYGKKTGRQALAMKLFNQIPDRQVKEKLAEDENFFPGEANDQVSSNR